MRKLITIIGLQLYALALAWMQSLGGVRTDEAKYLLNIPYPHPPLLRWIMSLTEWIPFQEMLWRVIWATLFIQAVWLVWDIGRRLELPARIALCGCWLLSGGVILYAGVITLAPINAVQALALVWLLGRPEFVERHLRWTGLYWLAMLFSGYQAVLYLPLAVALFWNVRRSFVDVALFALAPVGLLVLYTLGNPLAMASLVHHGGEQLDTTLSYKLFHTMRLWMIGGSAVASVLGVFGLLLWRRWEYLLSFVLVTGFIFLNWFEYYSPLFTPLLIAGLVPLLQKRWIDHRALLAGLVPMAAVMLSLYPFHSSVSTARLVMQELKQRDVTGTVMINGPFGHEWQYEASVSMPVRQYQAAVLHNARAVVCLKECSPLNPEWEPISGLPVEVWVR